MKPVISIGNVGICQWRVFYEEWRLCSKTHTLCTQCLTWYEEEEEETDD